jgi:hypothetical protein
MRVLEIMNDFRTLQVHINSLTTRSDAHPPDTQSYYLDGYVVLRQCEAESQAILAMHYNPGNLGLQSGPIAETEVQKATLQRFATTFGSARTEALGSNTVCRIILDAGTRRLQAHKIYLRASAAMRWVQMRAQLLRGEKPGPRHVDGLRAIDRRLREVCLSYLWFSSDVVPGWWSQGRSAQNLEFLARPCGRLYQAGQ